MFERTNAAQRSLLKANLDVTDEFSPEFLVYQENTRTRYGLNATYGIGKNIVAYVEWSGGDRGSLIAEAFDYGKLTGTLPANAPQVLPSDTDIRFRQDLATGLSYATANKVTLYLEYDYHEAGLSRQDWKNWFAVAHATRNSPPVVGLLWYLRSYAVDQQEPLTREAVFLRVSWTDAFVRDLELSGLVSSSQYDDSNLAQVTASYYLSNHWTIGALGTLTAGSARSEQGSLPLANSILLKAIRYF